MSLKLNATCLHMMYINKVCRVFTQLSKKYMQGIPACKGAIQMIVQDI